MEIQTHHIVYAARNSLGISAVLFVAMAVIGRIQGASLIDHFYADVPIGLFAIGYYASWVWRTQRKLPKGGTLTCKA
jgi:hypothetical protein